MDPQPAYALGRGLKTLPLRVAQHNANALAVAQFLEGHRASSASTTRAWRRIPTTRSPRGR